MLVETNTFIFAYKSLQRSCNYDASDHWNHLQSRARDLLPFTQKCTDAALLIKFIYKMLNN